MEQQPTSQEAELLAALQGHDIPYVPEQERLAAVRRAMQMVGIHSRMTVEQLLDLIGTNEEQLAVHNKPSDPDDLI